MSSSYRYYYTVENEIIELMQNTSDEVGLLFDTGHAYFAGAVYLEF